MASSSTSSVQKSFDYDVFLSFRGTDTRTNFVDHLYSALSHKSIRTYKDDERIKKGKRISDELIGSIQNSKLYIIVFSKNYASSSWCLDELVEIMECHKKEEHTAYPVFYDVEPTEVRKQTGAVGEAFANNENKAAAGKWREALKEAADLAGWELKNTADGHEAKFIQKIIEEISLELRSINLNVDEKIVGMETRVEDVVSSLAMDIDDVRMIGIKGIGGGGKTTLARAVFDKISFQFEGKSFVENVREVSNASLCGLKSLQNQVLLDVFKDQGTIVSSVYEGKTMIKRMMRGRKVLVVLDDVDHRDQLEALAGEPNWFKPGSRIIITTRDEQVLVAHGVKLILNVNLLLDEEAICLFSRYAFGREIPIQGYEELSGQVVRYAAGLPLTIRVLGSFLCGKHELEWVDALERLKTIPLMETLTKLELSYNGLEEDYKEIFLDVACILKGGEKDDVIQALESCGFHARNGLRVLEQKSLITVVNQCVDMHDHIEEMGRNIVRRSQPPNKHSRLWINKEIEDILANDLGTEAIRSMTFCTWKLSSEIFMKGLRKINELRYLSVSLERSNASKSACFCWNWKFSEAAAGPYLPNTLRYLNWSGYPHRSLPGIFEANNLVSLKIISSEIIQLWEGGERKVLNKLRFLDLSHSMLRTLDLGLAPNLETLTLRGCCDLIELHFPVACPKLKSIDLTSSKLSTLELGRSPDLEMLCINRCYDLVELHIPNGCVKLKNLNFTRSKLRTLNIGLAPNLEELTFFDCQDLVEFHIPDGCVNLKNLNFTRSKLRILDLGLTPNLETLILEECEDLVELHMLRSINLRSLLVKKSKLRTIYIGMTSNLETLELYECKVLEELHMPRRSLNLISLSVNRSKLRTLDIGLTPNLGTLVLDECEDLVELHMPGRNINLITLRVNKSKLRTLDIGLTPNLDALILDECEDLVELHMPRISINLRTLLVNKSKLRTLDIGLTPNLEYLIIKGCYYLGELHMSNESQKLGSLDLGLAPNLKQLDLNGCYNLVLDSFSIKGLENLFYLDLSGCLSFESFLFETRNGTSWNLVVGSTEKCRFHPNNNLPKCWFTCFYKVDLPWLSRNLEKLIALGLCACTNLETFSGSICGLEYLRILQLKGSIPEVPKDFDRLECLEMLTLSTNIICLPDSICMLKHLESLRLVSCRHLEKLPDDLGRLECLEDLYFSYANIKHLPDSISMLKHLKYLRLVECTLLEKLPEDLGRLECLEELSLSSTKIKYLPDSICMLKHLIYLRLVECSLLEKLPEDLGRLECLEELSLSSSKIKHLPDSICMLKHLGTLELKHCSLLEKLPKDLGGLDSLQKLILTECKMLGDIPESIHMLEYSLQELDIDGTCINHLPRSILRMKGLHIVMPRGLLQSQSELQTANSGSSSDFEA